MTFQSSPDCRYSAGKADMRCHWCSAAGESLLGSCGVCGRWGRSYSYWEAACGIANEVGLMMAECTCSAVLGAEPRPSGKALLGYMELTRVALERCATARAAIELMGSLAEEHGFHGNDPDTAESLAVIDKEEAWVFHILADDSGASAIWAAQKVPDGHAAAVANQFVIRKIDLEDRSRFLYSDSALDVAERLGLWERGTDFDFAACFSAGEARHCGYSGRRVWRALSLFAPSLQLQGEYTDLLTNPVYPFSVLPDAPITRSDFFSVMRDNYEGTKWEMSKQPAAGPFGVTDRWDGAPSTTMSNAHFERPIGVYRMAYSYIGEAAEEPLFYFGPHVSTTAVYCPVLCKQEICPAPLGRGSVKAVDRKSAFWAFRRAKATALGLCWDRCLPVIRERQAAWEAQGLAIVADGALPLPEKAALLCELAEAVVADWADLDDELMVRFSDGWEQLSTVEEDGSTPHYKPLKYP